MESGMFTIQPYDGGEERSFFNRLPFSRRAELELMRDPEYKKLGTATKNGILSVGMRVLAARKEGLDGEIDLPEKLTVESLDAFSEEYAIQLAMAELPKKPTEKNPTVTSGATS